MLAIASNSHVSTGLFLRHHAPLPPDILSICCCVQMLALMPRANHTCRSLVARWLIAFCRASKWYIREDEPLAKELTPWLEPNELKQLVRACGGWCQTGAAGNDARGSYSVCWAVRCDYAMQHSTPSSMCPAVWCGCRQALLVLLGG